MLVGCTALATLDLVDCDKIEGSDLRFAICLNPSKDSAPAALQGLLAPVREAARVQAATCPPVLSKLSVQYRCSLCCREKLRTPSGGHLSYVVRRSRWKPVDSPLLLWALGFGLLGGFWFPLRSICEFFFNTMMDFTLVTPGAQWRGGGTTKSVCEEMDPEKNPRRYPE